MSKYKVTYYPEGDLDALLLGASILYDYRPELRSGFGKREFLETVHDEMAGLPLIACFQQDTYCGAITFSSPRRDVHHTGLGRSVYTMTTVPGRVGAFHELLKALDELVRSEGGSWVSLPKRLSLREVKIIYRSV